MWPSATLSTPYESTTVGRMRGQRQLAGARGGLLQRVGDGAGQERSDAQADALVEHLEAERDAVLETRVGEQALDRELQVVELLEAEVEPVRDATENQPDDGVPLTPDGRDKFDSIRHASPSPAVGHARP